MGGGGGGGGGGHHNGQPVNHSGIYTVLALGSEMTRNAIESDFRSSKIAAGIHFVKKIKKSRWPYWMTENHFRSHFSPFQINTLFFFSQNGCRRQFRMTENHFRSHFSPFQINTLFFFSQNGCRRQFRMTENHFRSHFSPFQIKTLFHFFHKMAAGGHFGWPKITFDRISRHFWSIRNFFLSSQNI